MRSRQRSLWSVGPALVLFGAGCAGTGPSTTPSVVAAPSLVEAKRQVNAYIDSGRYEADIAAVADQARAYLESRVHGEGKLAIVLDVDETALSNLPSLRANDYGFIISGPCDLPGGPCGLGARAHRTQSADCGIRMDRADLEARRPDDEIGSRFQGARAEETRRSGLHNHREHRRSDE